ncbi:hypothetical protein [Adhaeribacter radiodurans]|uniref:Uncharacterized protein n=1 Tax=Adhaeribacter radiodurans TaxID=2745197 RepID=A0A7L7LCP9_9BACT|nr:hypothetical protein [Adhaeribacter radiodurans]QMU30149.1 hypothetical protein HUW48_19885 [Adhaeribacter radiodurans]
MDIQPNYKIVLRRENSEKDLMIIDHLTEAEANKVFKNLQYPTIHGGYVKVYFFKDMITRKSEIK